MVSRDNFLLFTPNVTGIDITPAMIEQANLLRQQKNLCNIKYEIGDVTHLPYGDESFTIVITRYSISEDTPKPPVDCSNEMWEAVV